MVTRNEDGNQVMVFGSDGIITQKLSYTSEHSDAGRIGSINYYRTSGAVNYFLVTDRHLDSRVRFCEVYVSGNALIPTGVFFWVSIPDSSYDTGNDSYFDLATKQLYVTRFKKENGVIKNNLIMQYDLNSGIASGSTYSSVRTLHAVADSGTSFEIEGLGIYTYAGVSKKYVCTNIKGASDAIYKLSVPKPHIS